MTAQTAAKSHLPATCVLGEPDAPQPDALRWLFLEHGRQAAWERQARLLHAQKAVMSIASLAGSSGEVLPPLLTLVQGAFPTSSCSIALAESMLPVRWRPGVSQAVPTVDQQQPPLSALNAPRRAAITQNRRITVPDIAADRHWSRRCREALSHGIKAFWIEPLVGNEGKPIGLIAASYPEPQTIDAHEEEILDAVSSFASFMLSSVIEREASKAAAAQLSALSRAIPGVVYQRVVEVDGQIYYTYISEGASDLFGVSAAEILSDPEALFSRHSPEYRAKFRERLISASHALTMWDVEATIITPDGRKKHTHAIARPERRDDGSVIWTGVILDETRTREALLESLSQGVLLYDADDKLIVRNSHFLRLFPGLEEVAVPGASYRDVVCREYASSDGFSLASFEHLARDRLERHREKHSMFECQVADDLCILINEHRTRENGTIVFYTDITELKRREKEVQHLAHHDALTGLPNRRLFQQRVEEALAKAREGGPTAAVLIVDLDNFKAVNDTLGHQAGDALLRSVAERLRGLVRSTDTVGRLGGDEFGIVIPDAHEGYVPTLGSRLLRAIGEPVEFNGQQLLTRASIGAATAEEGCSDTETLLKHADLALYRAKADGRGTLRFFEPAMDARAQARRALEISLRRAVANNELELNYQPQLDTSSGEVMGFEALVRWRHPKLGLIPPSEFIELAEETGIIVDLGEWVLRKACSDAMAWPPAIKVAVNVSPAQFRTHGLADQIERILTETGLPPHRLDIEITESLLMRDVEATLATLRRLKSVGIKISMDDFGTGFSSLGSLRSFPFDKIKIDRSFVSELERDEDSAAIVRAVLSLGRSLGMSTCAEGVETEGQLDRLRMEGCDEVQGFLYSKARPAHEVASMLRALATVLAGRLPL